MDQRNTRIREHGFSMVELLVSLTVMLLVAGAALSVLSYAQKMYSTQQMQADMHGGLRGAFELMSQEIGQAGALSSATYTFTPADQGIHTFHNVVLNTPGAQTITATETLLGPLPPTATQATVTSLLVNWGTSGLSPLVTATDGLRMLPANRTTSTNLRTTGSRSATTTNVLLLAGPRTASWVGVAEVSKGREGFE